jgi:Zn-finger nucleic acid-binding protein
MRTEQHSGISIDKCSACGSVWLDPGEFDAVRHALLPQVAAGPRPHWLDTESGWTWAEISVETVLRGIGGLLFSR